MGYRCHECGNAVAGSENDCLDAGWLTTHYVQVPGATLQTSLCPDCVPKTGLDLLRRTCLQQNLRIGPASQRLFPGYGSCLCCGTVWACIRSHNTQINSGSGCFPLCEPCWQELGTPEARMPFYRRLFDKWCAYGEKDESVWFDMQEAVLRGL